MWKWFKENVLRIRPIFKVKIEEAFFSSDWYAIKFSNNNGWTWRYILRSGVDIDSPCNELLAKIKYFDNSHIEEFASKMNTYEDFVNYNNKVFEEIRDYNREARRKYNENRQAAKDFMKKFNNR